MTAPQILVIAIAAAGLVAFVTIVLAQRREGSAFLAAILSVAFGAFTAVQLAQEGAVMFWINHSTNLTGVQVWWDLITATLVALFLLIPRAKAAGMNIVPWSLFVISTASIGLLAMCARLFWLERAAGTASEA
jgi:hypothetical protein